MVPILCFIVLCIYSPSQVFHLNVAFVVSKGQGQVQSKKSLKEHSGGSAAGYNTVALLLRRERVM